MASEATFPLSHSWRMMRPICCMQGQTVPCRLSDFKAVSLCDVPPSLILESAGGLFFFSCRAQIRAPHSLLALSKVLTDLHRKKQKKTTCAVVRMDFHWEAYWWSLPPSAKQIIVFHNNRFCFVWKGISWVSHIYFQR